MVSSRAAEYDASSLRSLETQADTIKEIFRANKYEPVEPPVLQPADIYLDRSGEDIRRRMYIFSDPAGTELCLRPDLTIPVCRMYLGRNPKATGTARLCYNGTAYRYQLAGSDQPNEFFHAGVEFIGNKDKEAADTEVLKIAIQACESAGLKRYALIIGDLELFSDLIAKLDIPNQLRVGFAASFARPSTLKDLVQRLKDSAEGASDADKHPSALLSVLGTLEDDEARAVVKDVLALGGIEEVGGRTLDEIASRFLRQASASSTAHLPPETVDAIETFLQIEAPVATAIRNLKKLNQASRLGIEAGIARLEKRVALMEEEGIPTKSVVFSTAFGRSFDYYTGFAFEVRTGNKSAPIRIASGGRYDGLLHELGAPKQVPAVGCSIWTERLLGAVRGKK